MNIARDEVHQVALSIQDFPAERHIRQVGVLEPPASQRLHRTCSMVAASAGVRSVGISECVAFVFMVLACRNQRRYR